MPMYHQLGKIPNKRHVVYRNSEGQMYNEELVGTQGFSSLSTLAYHIYPPTRVIGTGTPFDMRPRIAIENNMRMLSFSGFDIPAEEDYLQSRKVLFVNSDLHIGLAAPTQSPEYFFKNADADELIFIHKGSGTLSTMYGEVEFEQHDYLVIPRGTIYKIDFDTDDNRFLFIESFSPIYTPRRYRNEFG